MRGREGGLFGAWKTPTGNLFAVWRYNYQKYKENISFSLCEGGGVKYDMVKPCQLAGIHPIVYMSCVTWVGLSQVCCCSQLQKACWRGSGTS